jgi:putative flippase GtrA
MCVKITLLSCIVLFLTISSQVYGQADAEPNTNFPSTRAADFSMSVALATASPSPSANPTNPPTSAPTKAPTPSPTATPTNAPTSDSNSPSLGFYYLFCIIIIVVIALFLVRLYARPQVPLFAKFATFAGWLVSFSICFVLPLDLLDNTISGKKSLLTYWNVNYWLSFFTMWLVMPLLQSYYLDGGFTFQQRVCGSIKENVKFYAIAIFVLGIGMVVLAIQSNLDQEGLTSLLITLGNTWGMVQLVLMLGYGLVEVPRSLWHRGNIPLKLKYAYFRTAQVYHEAEVTKDYLIQTLQLLDFISTKVDPNSDIRLLLDEVKANCPRMDRYNFSGVEKVSGSEDCSWINSLRAKGGDYDLDDMIHLNYQVKTLDRQLWLCEAMWRDQVSYALHTEELMSHVTEISMITLGSITDWNSVNWWKDMKYRWEITIKPFCIRALSLIFAGFSIVVIWSEMTLLSPIDISPFGYMVRAAGSLHPAWQQILAIIPLTYMCCCSFYTLFSIRIPGFYSMFEYKSETDALLFNASLLMRVIAPMGNNFFLILHVQDSSFQTVVGNMDAIPFFGNTFHSYIPILISVFCILFAFNVLGRLFKCMRLDHFEYDLSAEDENVNEGKLLVKKEKRRRGSNFVPADESMIVSSSSAASSSSSIEMNIDNFL